VQIMVDGKPSAMLQGDNRGPALQAAADDIESIEVINNPGAQFGNEAGGGPILNLVMRRNRKPGGFTTVSATPAPPALQQRRQQHLQRRRLVPGQRQRAPRRPQFGGRRHPRPLRRRQRRLCPAASNRSATA
jgi:hypothetical protein